MSKETYTHVKRALIWGRTPWDQGSIDFMTLLEKRRIRMSKETYTYVTRALCGERTLWDQGSIDICIGLFWRMYSSLLEKRPIHMSQEPSLGKGTLWDRGSFDSLWRWPAVASEPRCFVAVADKEEIHTHVKRDLYTYDMRRPFWKRTLWNQGSFEIRTLRTVWLVPAVASEPRCSGMLKETYTHMIWEDLFGKEPCEIRALLKSSLLHMYDKYLQLRQSRDARLLLLTRKRRTRMSNEAYKVTCTCIIRALFCKETYTHVKRDLYTYNTSPFFGKEPCEIRALLKPGLLWADYD